MTSSPLPRVFEDHHRLFVVVLVAMAGILLGWQAWLRTENFRGYQRQLAQASAIGAAHELETLLRELHRTLRVFIDDHQPLVRQIAAGADADDQSWKLLSESVARHFPKQFGFTLADGQGSVLRPDFDNLVDEVCRQDIRRFVERGFQPRIYIHPNPLGYHFDVMVPWHGVGGEQGVFFVSFHPTAVARILDHAGLPQHRLLLLNRDRQGLIEVTRRGARDLLAGDFMLSPEELARVAYSVPVGGTRWQVVDLPDPALDRTESRGNALQAGVVFLVFCVAGWLMLLYVRGREERRRQAKQARRDSEARYRMLVENMNDGLAMQDQAGVLTYVNRRFCEIVGYSQQELLGQPAFEFIGKYAPEQWSEIMAARRGGNVEHYEWDLARRDGSVVHLAVSPQVLRDRHGDYGGCFGVVADLSARKRMEDTLRKLSQAVEQSPNCVIITDLTGIIEYVNPAFTESTGYAADEVIGETPRILKSGLLRPAIFDELWQTITAGRQWRGELCNRRKNGEVYWDFVSIAPIVDEHGVTTHFIGVQTDITPRKQAEEQAHQRQNELLHVARLGVMGEMATSLAHELNQPLSAISTYCQAGLRTLESLPERPERLEHALREAARQAQRAGEIIRRIRAFARKGKTAREDVAPNSLLAESLDFVAADLRRHSVSLHTEFAPDLPKLWVDPIQIDQVMMNLVRNAIDAMSESAAGPRELTIRSRLTDGGLIEVSVVDTGPGFDPDSGNRLFDAFYTTKAEGMGMGLAISRSIIEAHGGRLWAESQPGRGAIFRFTLPADGRSG